MGDDEPVQHVSIDPVQSGAFQRNRVVLTVSTVGLVALLVGLVAISDGETRSRVGLLGLAGVVAGGGLVTLDAWVRLPRPAPRLVTHAGGGAVRLRASTILFTAPVLLAAGLTMIAVSFLLAPSLASVAQGRRGGAWVYVVVVAAPLILAAAVVLLLRRDQVLLAPDTLTVRRHGRVRAVSWDSVREVAAVPADPGLVLRVGAADGSSLLVTTRPMDLRVDELGAVVRHLAATPADRAHLGTAAALPLIDELRRGGAPA